MNMEKEFNKTVNSSTQAKNKGAIFMPKIRVRKENEIMKKSITKIILFAALITSAFFIGRLSVTRGHGITVSAATTETETTSENANQEPMIPLSECIPLTDIACKYTSYTGYTTFELMDTTRQFDDVNGNLYSDITKDIPDVTQEYTENVIDLNSITNVQVYQHSIHITANDGNEYILDLDVD